MSTLIPEKVATMRNRIKRLEEELLNRIYYSEKCIPSMLATFSIDDVLFYPDHFRVLVDSYSSNKNCDIEISSKGLSVMPLVSETTFRQVGDICRDLNDALSAYRLTEILENAVANIPDDDVQGFIADLQMKLLSGVPSNQHQNESISALVEEYRGKQKEFRERFLNGEGLIGFSTGYKRLDEVIDGFRPGHLFVIGAYTSLGKTSASLNLAAEAIRQGRRVVFYSLEMSSLDVLSRLLGVMTNQSGTIIFKGLDHDTELVDIAMKNILGSDFTVRTGINNLSELVFSMHEEMLNNPVSLFIIDFIQLIVVKGAKSEYESMTAAATELQKVALKLKAPLIVLSQVSNEGAKAAVREVMSFKGSGAIAAAADIAIEIMRGEKDVEEWRMKLRSNQPVKAKWVILKNRHGSVGFMEMLFNGRTGKFTIDDGKSTEEERQVTQTFNDF